VAKAAKRLVLSKGKAETLVAGVKTPQYWRDTPLKQIAVLTR
jgi:hypothetical protein